MDKDEFILHVSSSENYRVIDVIGPPDEDLLVHTHPYIPSWPQ